MQSESNLAITLFFFSSAVIAGFEAMKAGSWRRWVFWILTILFAGAGLSWGWLKEISPTVTNWISGIATNPQSWFLLFIVAMILIAITGRHAKPSKKSNDLSEISASAQLTKVERSIAQNKAGLEAHFALTAEAQKTIFEGLQDTRSELASINNRAEQTGREIAENKVILEQLTKKIETIDAVATTNTVMFQGLQNRVEADHNQAVLSSRMISTAMRAHDAEAILKAADSIILETAPRLLDTKTYFDDDDWLTEYRTWSEAVTKIDKLCGDWSEHHVPFLNLRRHDYENASIPVPDSIKSTEVVIPYKTVSLAHQRYEKERENIFSFFAAKARQLPG